MSRPRLDLTSIPTLDAAHIARLVQRFDAKARDDALLGPVFRASITDPAEHQRHLAAFWCSVVLRTGAYRGNPMRKHKALAIDRRHFARWLELWRQSASEVMDAMAVSMMTAYAERIGKGIRMGLGIGDRPRGRELGVPMFGPRPRGAHIGTCPHSRQDESGRPTHIG